MTLSKKKTALLIFICVFILPVAVLFYIEKKTDFFKDFEFKQKESIEDIKAVKCSVQTNLDNRTFVSLTFLIPYTNEADHASIKRAIPQIRNKVIQEVSTRMIIDIEDKNFKGIKEKLIEIVNSTVDTKITEVYLDNFNLMDHPGRG
ncbi:MAG: hypothetical protein K9L30_17230 [Desulfobacterales bacterium]|nr:hypothetical protein [Desulfobacterales bacterium]